MEKEILEVAALVDQLRREDTDFRVFGAEGHEYRIGPTLSETEIRDFEQKHRIVLPPDYRLWLQIVGDGSGRQGRLREGVGPNHGIYHLRDTVIESRPDKPFKPFPLRCPEPHFNDSKVLEIDLDEGENAPGVLDLGTMGCAYQTYLVVNGKEWGQIWESRERTYVWTNGFTFSEWVRNWAEDHLQVFANKPLIGRIQVGMSTSAVIESTNENWKERRTSDKRFFENASMKVQLELDDNRRVIEINSYFFR